VAARLEGKRAVVTGAAQGIGAAIARAFVLEGARVVLVDTRADRMVGVAEELAQIDSSVCSLVADITTPSDVDRVVAAARVHLGGLDVLVNNAGVGGIGHTILETDLEEWDRMLRGNLTGCFLCCRAALPLLRESGRGSIINLSSITGLTGTAGSVAYGAAKAGVLGLTRSLARETAQWRVNVNAIAPGLIDTEMSRARGQEAARAAVIWPRIGQPEDVAALAVFLASDEAEFITGQVISPNGGALI
jgi:3-oxoacyl-[acyl-carrier protein] reductase